VFKIYIITLFLSSIWILLWKAREKIKNEFVYT